MKKLVVGLKDSFADESPPPEIFFHSKGNFSNELASLNLMFD